MSYKKPDRKKKRIRKSSSVIIDYSMVKSFKKKHPEHKLSKTEYSRIVKQFNENMMEAAVDNRDGIRLPEMLGLIMLVGYPRPKRKIIDFAKSNETGEVHYHKNWDTDNKVVKIRYQNTLRGYSFRNCRFWGFIPSKRFKKMASDAFKKSYEKYVYVDNKNVV